MIPVDLDLFGIRPIDSHGGLIPPEGITKLVIVPSTNLLLARNVVASVQENVCVWDAVLHHRITDRQTLQECLTRSVSGLPNRKVDNLNNIANFLATLALLSRGVSALDLDHDSNWWSIPCWKEPK